MMEILVQILSPLMSTESSPQSSQESRIYTVPPKQ